MRIRKFYLFKFLASSPVAPPPREKFLSHYRHPKNVLNTQLDKWFDIFTCCCCCKVASVMADSVRPHRWPPTRLPHPWDSPGKNTGVGCHFLLQGIFLTQGLNPCLLWYRQILYRLSHQESPETPPSSRAEGLLSLHGLESNPGSSLPTEEEAGLP